MSQSSIFKRFTIANVQQLAATQQKEQKKIRETLKETFPALDAETWEEIIPKKQELMRVPCTEGIELICLVGEDKKTYQVVFFITPEGDHLPHLKIVHKYPWMLPKHQCDIGGCKFVVSGAPIMAPGLVHPTGGKVAPGVEEGNPVAVYIEGKQHAVSVGVAAQSSEQILKEKADCAVHNSHHLGDGLWYTDVLTQDKLASVIKKK